MGYLTDSGLVAQTDIHNSPALLHGQLKDFKIATIIGALAFCWLRCSLRPRFGADMRI
jgi:hypothetical protein